jgi:hypothetical protein
MSPLHKAQNFRAQHPERRSDLAGRGVGNSALGGYAQVQMSGCGRNLRLIEKLAGLRQGSAFRN